MGQNKYYMRGTTILLTTAPRGTCDILPSRVKYWQKLEKTIREICTTFGYEEIRTPIFEHTELFLRGIGNTTDIVSKEMYTFSDRGYRSITLRPENTASVVRAYLENKLYANNPLVKLFYIGAMFRYDRPQAGRFRQFHQFGVEAIGAKGPSIDAEIIALAHAVLDKLGLTGTQLLINSVGCPNCRPKYREVLQNFFREKLHDLCSDCQSRFEQNPLRILDCKNKNCKDLAVGFPTLSTCLCEECIDHFSDLQNYLKSANIDYHIDQSLVRGLDYYTKTAFEFKYSPLGAQDAVCGGGRYDGLIRECGGDSTPGIGFAMGIERILLALEKQNLLQAEVETPNVFIVSMDKASELAAFGLLNKLRINSIYADMDFNGRSFKSQMKLANKLQAKKLIIIGSDELANAKLVLKNMATGEQETLPLNDFDLLLLKI